MDIEAILQTIIQYHTEYISPYLATDYAGGGFQRFELPHLIFLGVVAIYTLLIIFMRRQLEDDDDKAGVREVMAQILIIIEIARYIWLYFYQDLAPLNLIPDVNLKIIPITLSSLLVWLSIIMLLRKRQKIYEIIYLLGTIPALYIFIMPVNSPYGFPHFYFFYTLIPPAIIFLSAVYMTVSEEMEINFKSVLRAFLFANIIVAVVYGFNIYAGTNFLNLINKPETSLVPLPDAPFHILYFEGFALASSLILYLPFLIGHLIRRRNLNADTERIKDFV